MKHEIVSLQAKLEDGNTSYPELLSWSCIVSPVYTDDGTLKKLAGKGWRNSVMQRRIYGRWGLVRRWTRVNQVKMLFRLTKSAKKEAEDWARQTKRTLGNGNVTLIIIVDKCNRDKSLLSDGDDKAEEAHLDLATQAAAQHRAARHARRG